jgi:geranylgeranyl transferase type-2 subunit beta
MALCGRGLKRMPERLLERHVSWVRKAQLPDGGFPGRRGGSDIYYTSFGLRAADLLGMEDPGLWEGAAGCLAALDPYADSPVACYCLMHSLWLLECHGHDLAPQQRRAREALRRLPRPAGVYDAYLTALCMVMAGRKVRHVGAARLIRSCRGADGGFADRPGERSGVNPTAAATQLLAACGEPADDPAAAEFVVACQTDEGGLAPWPGAPCADLLSTFTGMVALAGMERLRSLRLAPVARFARALQGEDGGFRGTLTDDAADPEYTFYGLGVLGLLSSEAARAECSGRDCCC